MIDTNDDIFRLILRCCKNHSKPDLHSFTIAIKSGIAFVDCRKNEVYIKEFYENETKEFVGLPVAAANRLEILCADVSSASI